MALSLWDTIGMNREEMLAKADALQKQAEELRIQATKLQKEADALVARARGNTGLDSSQNALRVVREATEGK